MKRNHKARITSIALEIGFMLSTAHGQKKNKLIPVSDTDTLIAFAKEILKNKDYFNETKK